MTEKNDPELEELSEQWLGQLSDNDLAFLDANVADNAGFSTP